MMPLWLNSSYLSFIAPAIANHLWQSTAFALAAWIATLLLRRNAARVRFAIWLAASLKFLLPFSLLIALGGLLPKPQRAVVAAPVASAVDTVVLPFTDTATEVAPITPRPTLAARIAQALPAAIALLWLTGLAIVLAIWLLRWRRLARTLRHAELPTAGREHDLLRRIETRIEARTHARTPIPLLLSPDLLEPGLFGIFRPVLLWPARLTPRLDDHHIEAILAHELIHARRRDNLTAALHMFVEAIFWFHPLVWWMERRLIEERERACDEAVVALGSAPGLYADSLLKACRFCVESPLPCVSGITGADLNRRIRSIMTLNLALGRLTLPRKLLLATFAVAAVAAPLAFGIIRMIPIYGQILHATGPLPSFEVATIRPMELTGFAAPPNGGTPPAGGRVAPDGEQIISQQEVHISRSPRFSDHVNSVMTANMLIDYAYNLPAFSKSQIVGGPDWIEQTMYQIQAKIDDSQFAAMQKMSSAQRTQQIQLMDQSLLAERFKLKVHFETREMPVYALEVAKGGPKLTPAKTESVPAQAHPTTMSVASKGDGLEITAKEVQPGQLILILQDQPELGHRMVVDKTGLSGHYDLTLDWEREGSATAEAGSANADAAPSLFTALKEELGLQLVETKGPAEVLVIDQIERPSVDGAELPNPLTAPAVSNPIPAPYPSLTPVALAQTNPAAPAPQTTSPGTLPEMRFEVASIRPSPPNDNFMYPPSGPAENFSARMATVESMIGFAYNIRTTIGMSVDPAHFFLPHSPNLIGSPGWVTSDKYDLTAKADAETVAAWSKLSKSEQQEELRGMMRALLADRFHLTMKHDTRELPAWALVVSKGGPKFSATAGAPTDLNDGSDPAKPVDSSKPYQTRWKRDRGLIEGHDVTISEFDDVLWSQREIDSRKILDQTGLKGKYDLKLKWSSVDDPREPDGPSLFTAIQEQLGLKLESTKAPVDVLVIDHIDRPSEN